MGTAGIKFSKSFGGHVTALSRSEDKREKALGAGADEFYGKRRHILYEVLIHPITKCSSSFVYFVIVAACLGNEVAMAELKGKFDLIIDTSPQNSDVASFMGMLKFDGTYCRVG